jgi:hypothetical protein
MIIEKFSIIVNFGLKIIIIVKYLGFAHMIAFDMIFEPVGYEFVGSNIFQLGILFQLQKN